MALSARQAIVFLTRVEQLDQKHPGYADAWNEFTEAILAHGGEAVVPPVKPEGMIGPILANPTVWEGPGRIILGADNDCHGNVVKLYRDRTVSTIATGYALSDDGLWREHSWGIDGDGGVVETTENRIRYFGLEMTGAKADWFANWIAPEG